MPDQSVEAVQMNVVDSRLVDQFRKTALIGMAVICVLAAVTVAGWATNVSLLKRQLVWPEPMQCTSAISFFLLSGAALCRFSIKLAALRGLSYALPVIVFLAALAAFIEDITGSDIGLFVESFIERVAGENTASHLELLLDAGSRRVSYPGPMPPNISINFMLLSLALCCKPFNLGGLTARQLLVSATGVLCVMALFGHAGATDYMCTALGCVKMGMVTVSTFVLYCLALLMIEPAQGFMHTFVTTGRTGMVARRTAVLLLMLPVLLLARQPMMKAFELNETFSWAIVGALALIAAGVALNWNARAVLSAETARVEAEQMVEETVRKLARTEQRLAQEAKTAEKLWDTLSVREPNPRGRVKNVCMGCSKEYPSGVTECPVDKIPLITIAEHSLVGETFQEKYSIVEEIGSGGMGKIYRATHLFLKQDVAIKVLDPSFVTDKLRVKRFQVEARAASSLKHPNLIAVRDFGITQHGEPYMIMDYLPGVTLSRLIEENGPLGPGRFFEIFGPICSGLRYAHENGVIHRDLKPANVIVTGEGANETVHIVDFGLAKMTEQNEITRLTQTGEIFGSPLYMSPEQCTGEPADMRSDIYSLGCMMYECVTGNVPFRARTVIETLNMHLDAPPPPLPDEAGMPQLSELIARMMAKDPADRPQSVAEVEAELSRTGLDTAIH